MSIIKTELLIQKRFQCASITGDPTDRIIRWAAVSLLESDPPRPDRPNVIQVLRKADILIGKIWLTVLARRAGLLALAGLIAAFGLAMANVAAFYGLQPVIGGVWAATVVAAADFVIAAVVMLLARQCQPGPELQMALDVRGMAVDIMRSDSSDLKAMIEGFGQEISDARQTLLGLVHNPLDVAAQKLLIPAAISLIRGLRSKRGEA